MKKPKWNVAQAKALFDEGVDMRTIADTVGVKLSSLRAYANKYNWHRAEQDPPQATEPGPIAPAPPAGEEPADTHTHRGGGTERAIAAA